MMFFPQVLCYGFRVNSPEAHPTPRSSRRILTPCTVPVLVASVNLRLLTTSMKRGMLFSATGGWHLSKRKKNSMCGTSVGQIDFQRFLQINAPFS